ncbi:MAG: hypothetical protein HPAVJP_0580 [Candidatus Hepatoplasma vulgare]|nr:MAG: hypothetical protein HPAVJP_0580 [Candidatus Hepatoplasma sp.]
MIISLSANGWAVFFVFLVAFVVIAIVFSNIDWAHFIKKESRQTWVAVIIWMVASFIVATLLTFGIFMIEGAIDSAVG